MNRVAFLLLLLCALPGTTQTNARTSPATGTIAAGTIHGQILDPTHALIAGAKVLLLTPAGEQIAASTSEASGEFQFRGVKPGTYLVRVTSQGFGEFQSELIELASNEAKRIDITMAVVGEAVDVVVTGEETRITTEATSNASAVSLTGNDLGALADDPDELANELSALAGPSAGPNGGEIYIDGFSGGELPPKSAILQIRVNQNPFSAEFDRLGYGRIEILTKPGSQKLHGQALLQGNTKSLDTGNPFTPNIPAYHSYQFSGSLSGAISKTSSFSLNVDSRDIQSVNTWVIPNAVLPNSAGVYVDNPNYPVSVLSPHIRDNVSLRFDWQLGRTTMTARYGFWYENEKGNLDTGPGTMPSASTHESNSDHTIQVSSTTIFNDHFINESRIQFERHNENHYPDSTERTVSVLGNFVGGGFAGQTSQDHRLAVEFQNLSTLSHKQHAITFGTRLRDNRDANKSTANFNGTVSFSPVTIGQTLYPATEVYKRMANGLSSGQTFSSLVAQGFGPSSASYTMGNPSAVANVFDAMLFVQDDVRLNSRLTLSGGLRWEAQNHIADHNDWAPRVSLAYALDGRHGSPAKTVLRAGYGFFYDRLTAANLFTVNRSNAVTQIVLANPTCSSVARSLGAIDMTTCTSGTGSTSRAPVRYQIAPHYHAPYTQQFGVSLERQLVRASTVSFTYLHSFGVHQQVLRNANQPISGSAQTTPAGYLYQYFPQGIFKQHQIIASFKTAVGKSLSLNGFYTYSSAISNGAGGLGNNAVTNAYDLNQDLGRAGFVLRHVAFLTGTYNGPWGLTFNPFLISQSGRPFNITLPTDPLNNLFNQRPTYASATTPDIYKVVTPFGVLDSAALPGEQRVPINLGTGPANFAVNLRVTRAFSFGGGRGGANRAAGEDLSMTTVPTSTSGARPDRGVPGGGSLGGAGLSGGGGAPTAVPASREAGKYTLRVSVQALNLFNNVNYGTPVGVLGSPYFNRSTSLIGGAYSTGSASRRVYLQAAFSF